MSLNLSAIACASLKLRGTTRCTRTEPPPTASSCGLRPVDGGRSSAVACAAASRIGPVVVLGLAALVEPAHVRTLAVAAIELLLRVERLLVPVFVVFDDAEIDERPIPDLSNSHGTERF